MKEGKLRPNLGQGLSQGHTANGVTGITGWTTAVALGLVKPAWREQEAEASCPGVSGDCSTQGLAGSPQEIGVGERHTGVWLYLTYPHCSVLKDFLHVGWLLALESHAPLSLQAWPSRLVAL